MEKHKALIVKMKSGHAYVVSDYKRTDKGSVVGTYRQILADGEMGEKKVGPFPYVGIDTMFSLADLNAS